MPLAPEKVRTVQTAQGLSMDNCVMMLDRPHDKMSYDFWWLHVYVMLSRVRTAEQILLYGLPPRWLFERGPPTYLATGIAEIRRRSQKALEAQTAVAQVMGLLDYGTSREGADGCSRPGSSASALPATVAPRTEQGATPATHLPKRNRRAAVNCGLQN